MTTITASMGDMERLMSSVGVGTWAWDGDGSILTLDPTCKGLFGLDWDQDTPPTVLQEKIPAEDLVRYQEAINDCRRTGKFACEFRVRRAEGGYRNLSGRGHTVKEKGDRLFIKGVFIDVTATKNLETRLRATQSRMQQLVDSIPGLFSYIDSDYKVWFMSSQYREIFNREADDLVGVHIQELVGDKLFAERKPRYDAALAGEEVHSETSRLMPDGTKAYFSVTHKPFRDEKGEILGVLTLGIDITERRAMEEDLEAKQEELKRSNTDLEQFAYVASHDLKSPLRAIEVIVEWLREDLEGYSEGDVHENLDLLSQRTTRLARLLDDLLAYSRAGRKVGDVRHVHLDEFVKDIATLIAPPEGMEISTSAGWPCLTTHHAALETVLRNLISNAIKHHPDPANGHISVACSDRGDCVEIAVQDDGVGIPEEYADKVFKMFQTLKPRDDTEGSGMGLAIVQRIIDWQGGRIWFENVPDGPGVVFHFTWNKSPQGMPADEKSAAEQAVSHDHNRSADSEQQMSEVHHDHAECAGHDTQVINVEDVNDERSRDEVCEDITG